MKLKQKYTLKELSSIYGCEILGNELAEVNSVCSLSKASDKSISYISDIKYISLLTKTNLNCLITTKTISEKITNKSKLDNSNTNLSSMLFFESSDFLIRDFESSTSSSN